MKKNKIIKKNKKQLGGDIISASIDLINSFEVLGKSIYNELYSIQHIQSDINNVGQTTKLSS